MAITTSRKRWHSALGLMVTGAAVMTALVGCGSQAGGDDASNAEIRFSMWASGADLDVWADVIAGFEEANPGITVKFEPLDYGTYWTKLNTQLASGSAPDVVGMQFQSGVLGEAGQLAALDGLESEFTKIPESLLRVGQTDVDGEAVTYALPMRFVGASLYANTTALEAAGVDIPTAGWTRDDFVEAAKAVTTDEMYGLALPQGGVAVAFASTFGAEPVSADGTTATYDTAEMAAYKTWMRDLIYVDGVAPKPSDLSTQKDPFVTEAVGMTLAGSWSNAIFRDGVSSFDWDILPNPSGEFDAINYAGPDLISVTAASKHPEAAEKFLDYVVFDVDAQTLIANIGAPVLTELLTDEQRVAAEAALSPENYGYFVDQAVNNGGGWAFGPKFSEIIPLEIEADYQIYNSPDSDVEAILADLDAKVQALLDSTP